MYIYAATASPTAVASGVAPYVGNPGFGIHCHPLDSVNPEFIWRAPMVNPLIPLDSRTGIHKMGQTDSRFRIFSSLWGFSR